MEKFPFIQGEGTPATSLLPETKGEKFATLGKDSYYNEKGFFRIDYNASWLLKKMDIIYPPFNGDAPYVVLHINDFKNDIAYAWENPTTVNDCEKILQENWAKYHPNDSPLELVPFEVTYTGPYRRYDPKTKEYSGEPWEMHDAHFSASFNKLYRGIPLIAFPEQSYGKYCEVFTHEKNGSPYISASYQGQRQIGIEPSTMALYATFKETKLLKEDMKLCSFEKALQAYEKLIEEGKLRGVSSLRLGYVIWYTDNTFETANFYPTWVLEGDLYRKASDASYENFQASPNFGFIYVNAQTGELIDPWNESKSRTYDAPKVID